MMRPRRKPVNYSGPQETESPDRSFDSSVSFAPSLASLEDTGSKSSSLGPSNGARADAYLARITKDYTSGSVRSLRPSNSSPHDESLPTTPTRLASGSLRLDVTPRAPTHRALPAEWRSNASDSQATVCSSQASSSRSHGPSMMSQDSARRTTPVAKTRDTPRGSSSSQSTMTERELIMKLKAKIDSLNGKVKSLESQLESVGVHPVTKGGSMAPKKAPSKTEQKIAEIEAITLEIKKCLGIFPDSSPKKPVTATVVPPTIKVIAPATEPPRHTAEDLKAKVACLSASEPLLESQKIVVESPPPAVKAQIQAVPVPKPVPQEELSSDHLLSIMNSFGF